MYLLANQINIDHPTFSHLGLLLTVAVLQEFNHVLSVEEILYDLFVCVYIHVRGRFYVVIVAVQYGAHHGQRIMTESLHLAVI